MRKPASPTMRSGASAYAPPRETERVCERVRETTLERVSSGGGEEDETPRIRAAQEHEHGGVLQLDDLEGAVSRGPRGDLAEGVDLLDALAAAVHDLEAPEELIAVYTVDELLLGHEDVALGLPPHDRVAVPLAAEAAETARVDARRAVARALRAGSQLGQRRHARERAANVVGDDDPDALVVAHGDAGLDREVRGPLGERVDVVVERVRSLHVRLERENNARVRRGGKPLAERFWDTERHAPNPNPNPDRTRRSIKSTERPTEPRALSPSLTGSVHIRRRGATRGEVGGAALDVEHLVDAYVPSSFRALFREKGTRHNNMARQKGAQRLVVPLKLLVVGRRGTAQRDARELRGDARSGLDLFSFFCC